MKKLALGLAVALGIMIAASGGSIANPQGKKVAFLSGTQAHPFVVALTKTLVAQATAFGVEITTLSNNFDPALQAQQMDDVIARKFDLIAIMAGSEQAVIPALTRAKQAGIPVIMLVTPPKEGTEDLYVSFIGEDNVQLGRLTGESLLKAFKDSGREGGKVAAVAGLLQQGIGPRRITGFLEALKANPKVEVVAIEDARWDTAASERISGQLYARFAPQGGLDAVYGMADNQTVAAIQAAEAAGIPLGMEKGKLIVIGSNCLKQGIDAIKAGKQYSTGTQIPTWSGQRTAEAIADYFNGKPLPKHNYIPVETITKANVGAWEALCTY